MSLSFARQARLLTVLQSPYFSEKADQQYVFSVDPTAKKSEVKQAIEFLFHVKVSAVRSLNVKGKVKRFKQRLGKRKNWKKAYVTLNPGDQIDFSRH